MNVTLLIGAIVRQTMVLIAELATAGGVRAPLAHVADKVFVDLVLRGFIATTKCWCAMLHDLSESRLVFSSGSGADSVYRAASLRRLRRPDGLDELV